MRQMQLFHKLPSQGNWDDEADTPKQQALLEGQTILPLGVGLRMVLSHTPVLVAPTAMQSYWSTFNAHRSYDSKEHELEITLYCNNSVRSSRHGGSSTGTQEKSSAWECRCLSHVRLSNQTSTTTLKI
uniref:Uncharacterized protein n=1 Tax=Lepeophtheirus salmonis TaxID=72036 RepID=A0A0K2V0G0_LEPSM